jgi:hypothetical protein
MDATTGDSASADVFSADAPSGDTSLSDAPSADGHVSDAGIADAVSEDVVVADTGAAPDSGDGGCVTNDPTVATFPLDAVSGATAAYGLRKLRAAYSGPLVTVVRESDGTSMTVSANAKGNFPSCTVATFAAGGLLAVTKWFDQSGNGYDVVEPTPTGSFSAQAPTLAFNVHDNYPAVAFTYAASNYLTGSFPWVDGGSPWSSSVVLLGGVAAAGSFQPIFDYGDVGSGATGGSIFGLLEASGQFVFSFGPYGYNDVSTITTTAPSTYAIASTGASATGTVDGTSFTPSYGVQNVSGSTFVIGGSPAQFGIWLNGDIATLLLYPEALTAMQVATLQSSDRAYYGF